MSKPKYIKSKDGKFAGSIGQGKNAVPSIPPAISPLPESTSSPVSKPVTTTRSRDLHHFIEAHVRGWHWMAENGARPSTVGPWDFIPRTINAADLGTHPLVLEYPHLKPYLADIRNPDQIGQIGEDLKSHPAQAELLNGLYNYADDLEELSQIARGACWECESLEGDGYCSLHADIGNMDIEDFLSDTLPDVDTAVMDDLRPIAGDDPEAVEVVSVLIPNPFTPRQ